MGGILLQVYASSGKLVLHIVLEYCSYVVAMWIYEHGEPKCFTYIMQGNKTATILVLSF